MITRKQTVKKYTVTAGVLEYGVPFPIYEQNDVLVIWSVDHEGRKEHTLSLGPDYSVRLNSAGNGGIVTLVSGRVPVGATLAVISNIPETQELDLYHTAEVDTESLEDELDRQVQMIQQLSDTLARCIKVGVTSGMTPEQLLEAIFHARDQILAGLTLAGNVTGATMVVADGTTTPRSISDRLADSLNVKDFGAKGDGETDDTEAIRKTNTAATYAGKTVYFPDGAYPASDLLMTASWTMSKGAKIVYNGTSSGSCLSCFANNLVCGDIFIDCNEKELDIFFGIYGNGNYFRSINIVNAISKNILVRSLYVSGDANIIVNTVFIDLVNKSYWNNSSPQGLVLSESADGNVFNDVSSRNARSTVVNNSTGSNVFGNVYSYECKDNGFYAVSTGYSHVGMIYYDGSDNCVGVRHGANVDIDSIHIVKTGAYGIFFGECGKVNIGNILVDSCTDGLIGSNEAGTGTIYIGNIYGSIEDCYPIFLPYDHGALDSLTIDSIKLNIKYNSSSHVSRNSFIRLDACDQVCIGNLEFEVTLTDSTDVLLYCMLKDTLNGLSYIKHSSCLFFNNDGTDNNSSALLIKNAEQALFLLGDSGFVHATSGYIHIDNASSKINKLHGNIPTQGTWRRGQTIYNTGVTNNDIFGYICVESGTPGKWKTIPVFDSANYVNSLKIRSLQPTELFYPVDDNTVSVGNSSNRFSTLFIASGAISTSDERAKKNITKIDDSALDAWKEIQWVQYQFIDAIEYKGINARIHSGVIAQHIKSIFEKHGLDATRYGLLCYDKWDEVYEDVEVIDTPEIYDDDGNYTAQTSHIERRLITPAGDRYSVRYEEALVMEAAYQRRRADRIEARIAALEAKLGIV